MQEIKQWGPQDQDHKPSLEEASTNEPESQTPRRLSLDQADEPVTSSVHSLTPNHSLVQEEEASSSTEKVSGKAAVRVATLTYVVIDERTRPLNQCVPLF